jgi:hypothetical protein
MRVGARAMRLALLACAPLVCCGGRSTADPPSLTINSGTGELTWDSVMGADSYNLYVRTVGAPLGQISPGTVTVSNSDVKVPNATSPVALETYDKCNTSYFFAVSSVNGSGEGNLSGTLGFEPRPQCTP